MRSINYHRNRIWHWKICSANNDKWKKRNNRRNRTAKSGKNQKASIEEKIQVLENTGSRHHKTSRNLKKKKNRKERHKWTRKLLKTKLCSRNLIKEINIWVVSLVRYSGRFLKCTREERRKMNQRTRRLITVHKALYTRDDIDSLCQEKENSVTSRIALVHQYKNSVNTLKKTKQPITATRKYKDKQQKLRNRSGRRRNIWWDCIRELLDMVCRNKHLETKMNLF